MATKEEEKVGSQQTATPDALEQAQPPDATAATAPASKRRSNYTMSTPRSRREYRDTKDGLPLER